MEPDLECRTREYPSWACVTSKVNSAQFYCNHNFVRKSHKPCGFVLHVLRLHLCTSDSFTLGVLRLRVWYFPLLLILRLQLSLGSADFEATHMHLYSPPAAVSSLAPHIFLSDMLSHFFFLQLTHQSTDVFRTVICYGGRLSYY